MEYYQALLKIIICYVNDMNKSILILLLVSLSAVASEKSFIPKDVVDSWGYRIYEIHKDSVYIKAKKKFVAGGRNYFSRFTLARECFENEELAKDKLESILEIPYRKSSKGADGDEYFLVGECLYSVGAHADIFEYYGQDELINDFKSYIEKSHNKKGQQTPAAQLP